MTKAIQFTIDEALLRQVDRDPEVKRAGRSAFLRAAIRDYLGRRREGAIAAAYRRGYGQTPVTADEFGPLIEAQAWPEACGAAPVQRGLNPPADDPSG